MVRGLNQYRSYQVETAGREEQVVLLYDGARRFTDLALAALEQGRYVEVSQNTGKAQRIFEELSLTLNFEAGEISRNLWKLYDYWTWRLTRGVIDKDPEAFREVSATLLEMREAWAEAARTVRGQRAAQSLG